MFKAWSLLKYVFLQWNTLHSMLTLLCLCVISCLRSSQVFFIYLIKKKKNSHCATKTFFFAPRAPPHPGGVAATACKRSARLLHELLESALDAAELHLQLLVVPSVARARALRSANVVSVEWKQRGLLVRGRGIFVFRCTSQGESIEDFSV